MNVVGRHRDVAALLREADPLGGGVTDRRRVPRRGLAGSLALVLVVLTAAVTTPGQAAVEWVAERAGIADEYASEIERQDARLLSELGAALERVRGGELELSFSQPEAERLLELTIARVGPDASPVVGAAEGNRLERETNQLLDELRAQGAFPRIGACCSEPYP